MSYDRTIQSGRAITGQIATIQAVLEQLHAQTALHETPASSSAHGEQPDVSDPYVADDQPVCLDEAASER